MFVMGWDGLLYVFTQALEKKLGVFLTHLTAADKKANRMFAREGGRRRIGDCAPNTNHILSHFPRSVPDSSASHLGGKGGGNARMDVVFGYCTQQHPKTTNRPKN